MHIDLITAYVTAAKDNMTKSAEITKILGDLSALVTQSSARIRALLLTLDTFQSAVEAREETIAAKDTEIAACQQRIAELQAQVAAGSITQEQVDTATAIKAELAVTFGLLPAPPDVAA